MIQDGKSKANKEKIERVSLFCPDCLSELNEFQLNEFNVFLSCNNKKVIIFNL